MKQEVSAVLALALGLPVDGRTFSWNAAFALARRERCAPLAWLRSGPAIRKFAPPDVASTWRSEALSAVSLAEFWQLLLGETVGALREAGVNVVVLKGLPLARRLYGEMHVRPSSDLDLYVPVEQRTSADVALHAQGWTRRRGEPPNEAVYRIERAERAALLEVHSALLDDEIVAHLSFAPPGSREIVVGQTLIPAHDDAQLAGFLAAHLAKHVLPPLLWFIDFDTLWTALTDVEKGLAWEAAHAARAQRYLEWAIRRAADMRASAAGDVEALHRIGFNDDDRSERHSVLRVAALAAGVRDAASVVKAWLLPGWVRGGRQASALVVTRASKLIRRGVRLRALTPHLEQADSSRARPTQRTVTLSPGDLAAIVDDLTRRDAAFLIRATGRSMNPTIEQGMTVSLIPRGARPLRVGDVVLARAGENRCVLHRVVTVGPGFVETRGDANPVKDPAVPLDSILAIATGIVAGGSLRPIPRSRWIRSWRRARGCFRAATQRRRTGSKRPNSEANSASSARVE